MSLENLSPEEQISALVDGQLSGEAVVQTVRVLTLDSEARASWHAYHVVGDVLRSDELSRCCASDQAFLSRFRSRLENEAAASTAVLGTGTVRTLEARSMRAIDKGHKKDAANDAGQRWRWVAGLASLALVAVLGWNWAGGAGSPSRFSEVAQAPESGFQTQAATLDESSQTLIRDARLDQLLQAHQQFGGASALQKPSGFFRNATFDRPAH